MEIANLPAVHQPALTRFNELRPRILADVVKKTCHSLSHHQLELLLGEALYSERVRLRHEHANLHTRWRKRHDQKFWKQIQAGILQPAAVVDRKKMLEGVVGHFSDEIGAHFDPRVYRFASKAAPMGFNWLLNAASVRRFLPWGGTESIDQSIHLLGEIPMLQNLSRKGTILLVPTHQSNIDSLLIGSVIARMNLPPFSYGAGLNLFSNPLFSFFMGNLGAYTVDRKKSNQIYKETLKNYSVRILREGVHSIFFPGGGRARSGAIESKLKLGLLGTALEAQLFNHQEGRPNPSVYIVPMVLSYHSVLEASSLIEDFLADSGKHRFIPVYDEDPWQWFKIVNFFWKLFAAQSSITVRIGRALDIFGNFVDEEGRSIGPNGTTIDPRTWLTTRGELRPDPQRDREYVHELGRKIVTRFHRENTVLSSHLVAFAFFETLRKQHRDLDVYRLLRLSLAQRSVPYVNFVQEAKHAHEVLMAAASRGELFVSEELQTSDHEAWIQDGVRNLGLFHGAAVVSVGEGAIWTEDMTLLYYYRNRLSGYGLTEKDLLNAGNKGFLD